MTESLNIPDTMPQWLCALAAATQNIIVGSGLSLTMVLIPALQAEPDGSPLKVDLEKGSWLVMSFLAFGLFGCFVCGLLGDMMGRKRVLILLLVAFLFSWMIVAIAQDFWVMQVGRCLMGFADSGSFAVAPVYLGEIADRNLRGSLVNLVNAGQSVGMLLVVVLGWALMPNWRLLCWVFVALVVISLLLHIFYLPETPYFLVTIGKEKEAIDVLQRLRGSLYDTSSEMNEIAERWRKTQKQKEEEKEKEGEGNSKTFVILKTLAKPRFLKPFALGLPVAMLPMLAGYNSFFMYLINIFDESGTHMNIFVASSLVAFTRAVVGLLSSVALRYWPRKPLFMICGILATISLTLLGAGVTTRRFILEQDMKISATLARPLPPSNNISVPADINNHDDDRFILKVLGYSPVVTLMLAFISFSLGIESVYRVVLGEIFPTEIRSVASGICNIFAVAGMSIASFLFPRLLTWVGFGPTFWFYAIVTIIGTIYIFAVMPESKGKSLTDMENHFDITNNSTTSNHENKQG